MCCLTIQPLLGSLKSDLVIGFMDDVTLGGCREIVANDVETVVSRGRDIGLTLNVK